MNKDGADALAEKIGRTLRCKAQAIYRSGAWVVTTPDATYTGPFDWYYQQAQLKSALRKLKAMSRYRVR